MSSSPTIAAKDFAFDHMHSFPSDNRFKLREILFHPSNVSDSNDAAPSLNEAQVRHYLQKQPKTFSYAYSFPYPYIGYKRQGQKAKCFCLFPLSRILALQNTTTIPLDLVQSVLAVHPAAIRAIDEEGRLPLHYACRFGNSRPILEYLIKQFPEAVSISTTDGVLPFHYLCSNDGYNLDTVQWMMQLYPQSVQCLTEAKWTPLHYAAQYRGHDDSVAELLLHAHPDGARQPNKGGNLPLHIATASDRPQNIKLIEALLQEYPQGVSIPNGGLFYPLHSFLASEAPNKPWQLLNILIDSYPEAVGIKSRNKKTPLPLQIACKRQAPLSVFQRLLQVYPGAVRQENRAGKTTRELAAEFNVAPIVEHFLECVDQNLVELLSFSLEDRGQVLDDLARQVATETVNVPHKESSVANSSAAANQSNNGNKGSSPEIATMDRTTNRISENVLAESHAATSGEQIRLRREKLAANNLPQPVLEIIRADSERVANPTSIRADSESAVNSASERSNVTTEHSIRDQKEAVENLPFPLADILRSVSDTPPEQVSRSIVFLPQQINERESSTPGAFSIDGPNMRPSSSPNSSSPTPSIADIEATENHIVAAVVAQDVVELHNELESLRKQLAEQQQHQQQEQQQPDIVSTSRDIPVAAQAQVINTRQSCCSIL